MKVLLASASPRRKEILSKLLDGFDIRQTFADENFVGETPEETVAEIARRKADAALKSNDGYDVIIASDTMVALDGVYLGKPDGKEGAFEMLSKLNGRTHKVSTAVVVITKDKTISRVDDSFVNFYDKSEKELRAYIKDYPLLDKAGAYAIQDGVMVKSFSGSYTNIMGLPIGVLSDMFDELNIPHKAVTER